MNARRLSRTFLLALLALSAACTTPKHAPPQSPEGASEQPAPNAQTKSEQNAASQDEPERGIEIDTPAHVYADAPSDGRRGDDKGGATSKGSTPTSRAAPSASAKRAAAEDSYDDRGGGSALGSAGPMFAPPAPVPQRKAERPGLATSWGEDRYAPVQGTSFTRRSSEPMATLRALYNDRNGTIVATGSNWSDPNSDMGAGPVSVRIEDGYGGLFDRQFAGGSWHVVGERGARYVIVVANHSGARVEALLSVDGLDVITGKAASTGARGYIVSPYGELRVEGFRRSDSQVASFRFGSVSESYAARTGNARNVGVIGLALFEEQEPSYVRPYVHPYARPVSPPPYHWRDPRVEEQYRRDQANPFPVDPRYAQPPR